MKCPCTEIFEHLIQAISNLIDAMEATGDDEIMKQIKRERLNEAKYWLDKFKEENK